MVLWKGCSKDPTGHHHSDSHGALVSSHRDNQLRRHGRNAHVHADVYADVLRRVETDGESSNAVLLSLGLYICCVLFPHLHRVCDSVPGDSAVGDPSPVNVGFVDVLLPKQSPTQSWTP